MQAQDYGSPLFGALRGCCGKAWQAYVDHPFVVGLGDGSLRRECYLRYLRQDYVYLIHFTRAWALAVAKSDRIAEMRAAAAIALASIDEEMRLHVATCAAEGIDEEALAATVEEPETLAYTRFIIDAGVRGDLLDLLVALAPCAFGYGEIGARLAATARLPAGHPYGEWIASYAGPGYQDLCRTVGTLMEGVAARLIGRDVPSSPRWPDLVRTFDAACRLEADFWGMGLRAEDGREA